MANEAKTPVEILDADLEILNNLESVQAIYIDGVQGISVLNGVAKINCFQILQNIDKPSGKLDMKKIIVCRLAMSEGTFQSLARWFAQRASELENADKGPGAGT